MASKSMRPAASAEELTVVMTLEGHEKPNPGGKYYSWDSNPVTMSYVPGGKQMISGSSDKTARKWDLQTGKEINEARVVCELAVHAVAVSRDGRWIVTTGGNRMDYDHVEVELKAWKAKTGIMKNFKGHSRMVTSIDISADSKLLASGSDDNTARIWDLDTGKLVAGPFQTAHRGGTVQFSQNSMKLAMSSLIGKCLEVWDIQGQKLDCRIGNGEVRGRVTYAPVFWTTNDKSIVAVFTLTPLPDDAKTIYEFDSSTLDTVGVPFEGHTKVVNSIALSFDCALLASASYDNTIKLWAFESRQLLASFDIQHPETLILSPDLRHLAYTTVFDPRIYICNVPPNILASIRSAQEAQFTVCIHPDTCAIPALNFIAE
jgi:WD40 repeat protein